MRGFAEVLNPISEFGRVFEEQNLGIPGIAFNLAERIPNLDLGFFVTPSLSTANRRRFVEILDKTDTSFANASRLWAR